MKKFTLLTVLFTLLSVTAFAQKPQLHRQLVPAKKVFKANRSVELKSYTYGFSQALNGWTTIDADGDGHAWVVTIDKSFSGHDGKPGVVQSASYIKDVGPVTPDNYLVSPKMKLDGKITFYACAQDASYPAEHFAVAVSTTSGTDASAFTTVQEWTMTAARQQAPANSRRVQGAWYPYEVDLSSYEGAEGYVAIRHFNCTDFFYLNVDDITLETSELIDPYDEALEQEADPVVEGNKWVASEQGYENGEAVTAITIAEGVTGTLAQGENKSNAPKYYDTGTALRLYGGNTLTITSEEKLSKIAFAFDNAKTPDFSASTGEVVIAEDGTTGTWTGEATEIVFTVPNVSGAQTRIQSIEVTFAGDEPVTLPEGVVSAKWTIEGTFSDGENDVNIQSAAQLAKDGNDIYVQGLSYFFPEAWVKGTLDETTGVVTFPSGQFMGAVGSNKVYLLGYDYKNGNLCDMEFEYDAESQTLTQLTDYIFENGNKTEIFWYGYWSGVILYAGDPIVLEPVEVPEGLTTDTYLFTALQYEDDEEVNDEGYTSRSFKAPARRASEAYSYQAQVGFDGNDVYIKGLSANTADMWVKATKNADGKYVIPVNQYMGTIEYWYTFDYFLAAVGENGEKVDVVLNFDAETNTFSTDQMVVIDGSKFSSWYPYQTFTEVSLTKMNDVAATPADPSVVSAGYNAYNYPYADFVIPTEGTNGELLLTDKLFYSVWIEKDGEPQVYTFTAALYPSDFAADVVEVPYSYDGYDFYTGGERVYFEEEAEEFTSWTKIGVQSIYYGGGECHKSNVVWLENGAYTGISATLNDKGQMTNDNIYDLQGRKVANPKKGLYIVNGVKTVVK